MSGLYGAIAALAALRHRETGGSGQFIDLSLVEPLFTFLGPQALAYDQLGLVPERSGNATSWTSPRNAFLTRDRKWVALSASSQWVAERLVRLVGRPHLIAQGWFADHEGRAAHAAELDGPLAAGSPDTLWRRYGQLRAGASGGRSRGSHRRHIRRSPLPGARGDHLGRAPPDSGRSARRTSGRS